MRSEYGRVLRTGRISLFWAEAQSLRVVGQGLEQDPGMETQQPERWEENQEARAHFRKRMLLYSFVNK